MRFLDYVDPAQRFALRELEQGDLAELESMNKSLFYPYLRHVTGPRNLLDIAISAQSDEPRALYFIGITPHCDRQCLIGLVGAGVTDVCAADPAHSIEVGYALIPSFQKRGIARSALQAALPRLLTSQITEVLPRLIRTICRAHAFWKPAGSSALAHRSRVSIWAIPTIPHTTRPAFWSLGRVSHIGSRQTLSAEIVFGPLRRAALGAVPLLRPAGDRTGAIVLCRGCRTGAHRHCGGRGAR
jgi:RimJ/RimL family protein N-acetyltransferase